MVLCKLSPLSTGEDNYFLLLIVSDESSSELISANQRANLLMNPRTTSRLAADNTMS